MGLRKGLAVCSRLAAWAAESGGEGEGTVHSVFTHAVNFLFQGRMLTLLAEPRSLVPYGCTLAADTDLPAAGLLPGQRASLLPSGVAAGAFAVDWRDAARFDLSVDTACAMAAVPAAIDVGGVLRVLGGYPPDDGLSPLVTGQSEGVYARFLRPRLPALFRAVAVAEGPAAVEAVKRIAGCGIGLTPSSDDLLTGYFAAVRVLARYGRMDGRLPAMLPTLAAAAAERTNAVSGTFLKESGEGLVSRDFLRLLNSLFSGADEAAVQLDARRVASFGSTSGRDMLTGLVLAIQQHDGGKISG